MVDLFSSIVASTRFNRWILALILLSGILVGIETYPPFSHETRAGEVVLFIQNVILWIFVVEIVFRIGACGSKPWRYFLNPWNIFDFVIVAVCFLPFDAQFAMVLRMARLLRAVRLLTVLPKLQILVNALIKSIPSLGYIGILLLLHFYIYAVMGTFLFSHNDPIRFGKLQTSMMTLFEVLTLEGWNDVFTTQQLGSDVGYDEAWKELTVGRRVSKAQPVAAAAYFVSFIMLGTMIMLNLFTGVIVSSMQEAQLEVPEGDPDASLIHKIEQKGFVSLRDELELIGHHLREVAADVATIKARADQIRRNPAGGTVEPPSEPAGS